MNFGDRFFFACTGNQALLIFVKIYRFIVLCLLSTEGKKSRINSHKMTSDPARDKNEKGFILQQSNQTEFYLLICKGLLS